MGSDILAVLEVGNEIAPGVSIANWNSCIKEMYGKFNLFKKCTN